jgi:hypothetical protein
MIVFLEAIGIMSSAATGDKTVGDNEKLAKWKAARAKIEALKAESGADPASAKLVEKIDAKIALYESEIELLGSTASGVIGALNQQNQTLGRLVKKDGVTGKSTAEMASELEAAEAEAKERIAATEANAKKYVEELNDKYLERDLDATIVNLLLTEALTANLVDEVASGRLASDPTDKFKSKIQELAGVLAKQYFKYTVRGISTIGHVMNFVNGANPDRTRDSRRQAVARRIIVTLHNIFPPNNIASLKTALKEAGRDALIPILLLSQWKHGSTAKQLNATDITFDLALEMALDRATSQ